MAVWFRIRKKKERRSRNPPGLILEFILIENARRGTPTYYINIFRSTGLLMFLMTPFKVR